MTPPAVKVLVLSDAELCTFLDKHADTTLWKRIRYLDSSDVFGCFRKGRYWFPILVDPNNKIVGAVTLQENPYEQDQIWLKGCAVDIEFRGFGLSNLLLEAAAKVCITERKALVMSCYSYFGRKYLAPQVTGLRLRYPELLLLESPNADNGVCARDIEDEALIRSDGSRN